MSEPSASRRARAPDPDFLARGMFGAFDRYVAGAAKLASGAYTASDWSHDLEWCRDAAFAWCRELEACVSEILGGFGLGTSHETSGLVDEPVRVPLLNRGILPVNPRASQFRGIGWGNQLMLPADVATIDTSVWRAGGDSLTVTFSSAAMAKYLPAWALTRTIIFVGTIDDTDPSGVASNPITPPIRVAKPAYKG